jgi:hypothetical protein
MVVSALYAPPGAAMVAEVPDFEILIFFKRGSVPPRCTLGSTVLHKFFLEKRLELKSLKG